jgi:hypothetical protein
MTERQQEVTGAVRDGETAATALAYEIEDRPKRRETVRIAVIAAVAITLIGVALSVFISAMALQSAAQVAAAQEATTRDIVASQKLAEDAAEAAAQANETLKSRGQAPVPIPPPDPNDPTDTLVSAAAARVLAQLPEIRPSAAQLGAAVADYLIANPPGPTAGQISGALAGYLATNPPPSGPRGPEGRPGSDGQPGADGTPGTPGQDAPPITSEQIQQAFVDYVKANPGFLAEQLCASFGDNWSEAKSLEAADGTKYSLFGCITEITPGPSLPIPTE